MRLLVTPMRTAGVARPKHETQTAAPTRGDVIVGQLHSDYMGRMTDTAHFHKSGAADDDPLPPLLDVRLSWMGPLGFVLSGIEIVEGVAFSQSWWCRPE